MPFLIQAISPWGKWPPAAIILLILLVLLGIGSLIFFELSRDVPLKRKVFRIFLMAAGVLGLGIAYLINQDKPAILFLAVPAVVISTYFYWRGTRFCNSCTKMVYEGPFIKKRENCPRCGAKL